MADRLEIARAELRAGPAIKVEGAHRAAEFVVGERQISKGSNGGRGSDDNSMDSDELEEEARRLEQEEMNRALGRAAIPRDYTREDNDSDDVDEDNYYREPIVFEHEDTDDEAHSPL